VKPFALQSPIPHSGARRRSPLGLWLTALLGAISAVEAIADEPALRLDQLMAGYVLNFTKFVEWPEASHIQDIVICVSGNAGLYEALRVDASAASIGSHHVAVRKADDIASIAGCHVLYIERASTLNVAQLGAAAPMLTVSDGGGFAHSGGTIELFTQQNRLRFIINIESARHAGLRISSNLLELAASVEGGEHK
jgi:hypothetical protein